MPADPFVPRPRTHSNVALKGSIAFNDAALNAHATVYANVYQNVAHGAMKAVHLARALSFDASLHSTFLLRASPSPLARRSFSAGRLFADPATRGFAGVIDEVGDFAYSTVTNGAKTKAARAAGATVDIDRDIVCWSVLLPGPALPAFALAADLALVALYLPQAEQARVPPRAGDQADRVRPRRQGPACGARRRAQPVRASGIFDGGRAQGRQRREGARGVGDGCRARVGRAQGRRVLSGLCSLRRGACHPALPFFRPTTWARVSTGRRPSVRVGETRQAGERRRRWGAKVGARGLAQGSRAAGRTGCGERAQDRVGENQRCRRRYPQDVRKKRKNASEDAIGDEDDLHAGGGRRGRQRGDRRTNASDPEREQRPRVRRRAGHTRGRKKVSQRLCTAPGGKRGGRVRWCRMAPSVGRQGARPSA